MYHLIKTECRRIWDNKIILVTAVVIPLVVTLLLGYEFNEGVINRIPTVVCDMDQSDLSRSIIGYFADNDAFDVCEYVAEQGKVEECIRNGRAVAGVVIPKGFSSDVAQLKLPTVLMVYDGSSMAIASTAKLKATEILSTVKTGAAIRQMEARVGMNGGEALHTAMPITVSRRNLYNPSGNFSYFLMPGLCLAIAQSGIAMACAGNVRWAEEQKSYRSPMGYGAGKVLFYSILGFVVVTASLLMLHFLFKVPFRGSVVEAAALCGGLSFAAAALGCAASAFGGLIQKPYFAIMVTGVLVLPNTLFAGYTWPVMAMPAPYRAVAYLIPYYHAAENMRNLFLVGSIQHFAADMVYLISFGITLTCFCMGIVALTDQVFKRNGVSNVSLPVVE